jgi:transposase
MIRLTDEQWERIRDHFPEENIGDGRPGRKTDSDASYFFLGIKSPSLIAAYAPAKKPMKLEPIV